MYITIELKKQPQYTTTCIHVLYTYYINILYIIHITLYTYKPIILYTSTSTYRSVYTCNVYILPIILYILHLNIHITLAMAINHI